MATPKDIIEGGGPSSGHPEAPPTEALQNLTGKVENAATALQDGADLLKEKAAQLSAHERVLADKDKYGHFKAGSGFVLNEQTGAHDVDFPEAVQDMVAPAVNEAVEALGVEAMDTLAKASAKAAEAAQRALDSAASAADAQASANASENKAADAAASAATANAAKTAAQTAQTSAETAKSGAESAKAAADSAKTAAATSASNAANSATTAGTKSLDAAASATAAANSATAAATKASEASTSATAAKAAQTAAESAKSAADTSKTAAATSATNAASSATTAGTKADNAAASATAAAASATAASTAKTGAETAKAAAETALASTKAVISSPAAADANKKLLAAGAGAGKWVANASLTSKANSGRAAIAVNGTFTVPSYVVGANQLSVYLEGCLCDPGVEYSEVGTAGAASTSIKWLMAVPTDYTISIKVTP